MNEELNRKHLGHKTFWLLVLKRSGFLFLVLVLGIALYFCLPFVPSDYSVIANYVMLGLGGLLLLALLRMFLVGLLEYLRYRIILEDGSIKITRGILIENEMGIPFRRIKDVNIQRNLWDQIIGVSNLVLMILDEEGGGEAAAEAKIILPSLDKKLAAQIQDALLKNAEVDEVQDVPKV
jgi:uncharacterized membrane protein YdbT with pleckstrin-like domain